MGKGVSGVGGWKGMGIEAKGEECAVGERARKGVYIQLLETASKSMVS